jgi:hypothetical protein
LGVSPTYASQERRAEGHHWQRHTQVGEIARRDDDGVAVLQYTPEYE